MRVAVVRVFVAGTVALMRVCAAAGVKAGRAQVRDLTQPSSLGL